MNVNRLAAAVTVTAALACPATARAALAPPIITAALADTDQWWSQQGSPPPPAILDVSPWPLPAAAVGYYNTGHVTLSPTYVRSLTFVLRRRNLRRRALIELWTLLAHERGHNLGYEHTAGGLMDPTLAYPPSRAYSWTATVLHGRTLTRR